MRTESMKLFAQLLEAYLPEDSSAMTLFGSRPGGKKLIQKLHRDMQLAHDQTYDETKKVSYSEIKNTRYGAWVLVQGTKGSGAIQNTSRDYNVISVDKDDNLEEYSDGSAGKVYKFLKDRIGEIGPFYVGVATGEVQTKKKKRAELSSEPAAGQVTTDTLIMKFRPLWLRAMTAAEADIKGMIATMIKNSAYDKARRKMDQASNLLSAIERLETGTLRDAPTFVKEAVSLAVAMAAAHYYPEETGEIRKDYRSYTPQFSEGPTKLLKDISEGDTAKLGTVLGFFKRSLISG